MTTLVCTNCDRKCDTGSNVLGKEVIEKKCCFCDREGWTPNGWCRCASCRTPVPISKTTMYKKARRCHKCLNTVAK